MSEKDAVLDGGIRDEQAVLEIYRQAMEELRFIKQQSWQIVYYVLLIDSAVVAVAERVGAGFRIAVVVGATALGVWRQVEAHHDMTKNRGRIRLVRRQWSSLAEEVFGSIVSRDDDPDFMHKVGLTGVRILLLVSAAVVALYLALASESGILN